VGGGSRDVQDDGEIGPTSWTIPIVPHEACCRHTKEGELFISITCISYRQFVYNLATAMMGTDYVIGP
jgi:hypothetical protein